MGAYVKKLTSSDGGLYFGRIEQQLLGRGSHSDLLSSPVQPYGKY